MDFHTLKRKELQALCKKHKIPANLTNVAMADSLAALLKTDDKKPKEQPVKPCLKNLDVLCAVDEEFREDKEAKKVRFSPQNQTFEFEKTNPREMRLAVRRRKSMVMGDDKIAKEEKISAQLKEKGNARVTRSILSKTVSPAEDACAADCQERRPETRNTRQHKRSGVVAETVSATEVSSMSDQCQNRRSKRVAMKRVEIEKTRKQENSRGELNEKRSGVVAQEKRVSLRNKQPKKQENSTLPKKSDEQKRCVGKRKVSSIKHAEELQTDPLPKSVDLEDIFEAENLVNSVCEAADLQNMLCNDSGAVEDNEGKRQRLHQSISPNLLQEECKFKKATEGSCETSAEIKEVAEGKAMLTNESSSEIVVPTKQPENFIFSSGGEKADADESMAGTDKEKECKAEFLNGDSSEDAEIVLLPSSGIKTSPKSAEMVSPSSSGFKTFPQSVIATVLRSCTKDSKTELEISASEDDICAQSVPSLTSTFTEPVIQGICQTHHETVISRSMIVDCEPNNEEVSPIKSTELEDRCDATATISVNEQLIWTNSVVDSATPKEEGIIPDFHNLEGQVYRDDMADVKFYPNIDKFQSMVLKLPNAPQTSTMESNVAVDSESDKCMDHLGTHDCKNVEYDQDAQGVTRAATIDEKIDSSVGMDTSIYDNLNVLEVESNSQTIHDEANVVISNVLEGKDLIDISNVQLNDNDEISERSEYPADSDINQEKGLEDETISKTITEANGIEAENDSALVNNVPEERDMIDVSDAHPNENQDAVFADQHLEKDNIMGFIPEAEGATPPAMVDERYEGIKNLGMDSTDDTAGCERTPKQELEKANNSQLTSGGKSYGIATLLQHCFSSSNEQDQLTLTNSTVHSATPQELQGIMPADLCNLEGQISRHDISDVESYPSLKFQDMTSMISDELLGCKTDKCIGGFDTNDSGENVGYEDDTVELTLTPAVAENMETSEGPYSCIRDMYGYPADVEMSQKQGTEEETNSQTPHKETGGIHAEKDIVLTISELDGWNRTDESVFQLNDNHEDVTANENLEVHLEKGVTSTQKVVENIERSAGFHICIKNRFQCLSEIEMDLEQDLLEETNLQSLHEETEGSDAEKDSAAISSELDGRDMTEVSDVQLNDNNEDAVLTNEIMVVHLERGNIFGYFQEAEEAIQTASVDERSEGVDTTDCERNYKQGLEEADNSELPFTEDESYGIASLFQSEDAEIDNDHNGSNVIDVFDIELDNNRKEADLSDPNMEVNEKKAGSVLKWIQEAEEDTLTAMIEERSEGIDITICDGSDYTTDCERSQKKELEESYSTSAEESYGIASLFQLEYAEDATDLINTELKGWNLNKVSDIEMDNSLSNEVVADPNMEVDEGKEETRRETYGVSERLCSVSHSMDMQECGSNSQNTAAFVLQGSEEKLIQSSVDEEKLNDESGTCIDSNATVALEIITEQTDQQSSNENVSFASEPEKCDILNFSHVLEDEETEKEKAPHHQELIVTNIDDQCKSAGISKEYFGGLAILERITEETTQQSSREPEEHDDVKANSKEAEIRSQLEMKPMNDEAEMNQKRSVLIHGTPRRPIKTIDMKENSNVHLKRQLNLGDATVLRPLAKRKALGELHRR